MQHLHRELPEIIIFYLQFSAHKQSNQKKVLTEFFYANQKGVTGITQMIFNTSNQINGRPTGPTITNDLRNRIEGANPRKREMKAIKNIITALDRWLLKKISNEQCMILCDQAIEDWLKGRLRAAKTDRRNFNVLRDDAVANNLITKMESYRLKRFHVARNKVQHRGGKASVRILPRMIDYYLGLANKYYS